MEITTSSKEILTWWNLTFQSTRFSKKVSNQVNSIMKLIRQRLKSINGCWFKPPLSCWKLEQKSILHKIKVLCSWQFLIIVHNCLVVERFYIWGNKMGGPQGVSFFLPLSQGLKKPIAVARKPFRYRGLFRWGVLWSPYLSCATRRDFMQWRSRASF